MISVCVLILGISINSSAETKDSYEKYREVSIFSREKMINEALDQYESAVIVFPYSPAENFDQDQQKPSRNLDYALIDQKKEIQRIQQEQTETFQRKSLFADKATIVNEELDKLEVDFKMYTGVRVDELSWTIAGNSAGNSPNILSELEWDDVWSYQLNTKASVLWDQHYRLEGSLGYGLIYSGKNTDRDYLGDNRSFEFSRSHSKTQDDYTFDSSIGIGYQFTISPKNEWQNFLSEEVDVALLAGLSRHEIRLKDRELYQEIPAAGSSSHSDINAIYKGTWEGPWLGLELSGQRDKVFGFSRFEYHWADYFGEADWVLRTSFAHPVSFVHDTEGTGYIFSCGGDYFVTDDWKVGLNFHYQNWEMKHGIDRTFFSNGSVSETQLNEVKWRAYSFLLSATYHFSLGDNLLLDMEIEDIPLVKEELK